MSVHVIVGSHNPVKLAAIQDVFQRYDSLRDAHITTYPAASGVPAQPMSLEETVRGAMNRARTAYTLCDMSIGLEGGLIHVPYATTGYMNVCACAIHDGDAYALGLSSGFEHPPEVIRLVLEEGFEISDAYHAAGITHDPAIGSSIGAIGILTQGKLDRKEYMMQAVVTALIHTPYD